MRNALAVPHLARTVSGSSEAIHLRGGNLGVVLDVTAASGTSPVLTISVHWSANGQRFFSAQPTDVLTAMTAAGGGVKWFAAKAPICRIAWTITGTGTSFSFSVDTCSY